MESKYLYLKLEVKNRLAHITLKNPPDNFLTHDLLGELSEITEWVAGNLELMGLILSASGNTFSNGFDFSTHDASLVFSMTERFRSIANNLLSMECPTIAVVDGTTRNWGCDLLFFFDQVLASAESQFHYDNFSFGTYPPVGSLFMGHQVGPQRAFQILVDNRPIPADEARQMGIITRVCPKAELLTELRGLIGHIAGFSSAVTALSLRTLRRPKIDLWQAHADDIFSDYLNLLPDLADYAEGLLAWREKRPAVWKNR